MTLPVRVRIVIGVITAAVVVLLAVAAVQRDSASGEPPPAQPPGLGDFWSGRASPVLDRKWTSAELGATGGSGGYSGSHIEVVGGTWYLFTRRTTDVPCQGRQGVNLTGTEVRESADRGVTWSAPVAILIPTPGSAWSCVASDGDAAFDERTTTWHYLFQCRGDQPGWGGCYVSRRGASPLGPFSAPQPDPNPVIGSGALWRRICDPGDTCAHDPGQPAVVDEGTFNLFGHDGEGWLVGFHGFDGRHAFRGVARTTTFGPDGWKVDGQAGTPTDAVVGPEDAAGWRESWQGGPVGPGAGTTLEEAGWYYLLTEVPDISLACTAGQNWDVGLFRTSSVADTPWEQYPAGNPVVYSSRAPEAGGQAQPCNVEYPGLFRDDTTGTTYMNYGRVSSDPAYDALYVYRLEWNRNLLRNGDFWRADAEGWQALAGTSAQLSVPREPNGSPDGTPYLRFGCGAPTCDSGQSVYQDVVIGPRPANGILAFGGTFRADSGTGQLDVAVHQLDAAGQPIGSTSVPVSLGSEYTGARGTLQLDARAQRLRFELYPRTSGTLRADNLYVIPQDGCSGPRYPAC
jgi:hypothetical protein